MLATGRMTATAATVHNHYYYYFYYYDIIIIIIIITIIITFISGNSSSNSTSRSIIVVIVIINRSSINKVSVSLTISTSNFELFICFLLFYINIPQHCFFLRDHNGNKVTQLFCVMPAIAPYGERFYHNFQF